MGYKTLELNIISAKDLKNVNLIGKMDVYVVVYLSDSPKSKQKTPVHQDGGTNPSWNYTMRFTIDEAAAAAGNKYLVFQLLHEHTFGADKELGEVIVSLRELLDGANKGKDQINAPQFLTYQVRRASGKAQGELKFSCKFIDQGHGQYVDAHTPSQSSCSSSSSATAYPPPPPGGYPNAPPVAVPYAAQGGGGYPPYGGGGGGGYPSYGGGGYPPQQGGYPPQPAGGYGYPYPPAGGYPAPYPAGAPGYPQTGAQKPQKPKKKNNFGMGLGAGLLGGAIGGLVLGDMVDDSFDDCGGFDF